MTLEEIRAAKEAERQRDADCNLWLIRERRGGAPAGNVTQSRGKITGEGTVTPPPPPPPEG